MPRTVRVFIGAESAPAIGDWVTVDPDPEVTNEAVAKVAQVIARRMGPDAEYGVMDTDDYPGESSWLPTIQMVVTVADDQRVDVDAVVAFFDHVGTPDGSTDAWELGQAFADSFRGEWESEEDYARDFAEEVDSEALAAAGGLAEYIDWKAYARDFFMGDYSSSKAPDGGVYVFDTNI